MGFRFRLQYIVRRMHTCCNTFEKFPYFHPVCTLQISSRIRIFLARGPDRHLREERCEIMRRRVIRKQSLFRHSLGPAGSVKRGRPTTRLCQRPSTPKKAHQVARYSDLVALLNQSSWHGRREFSHNVALVLHKTVEGVKFPSSANNYL